MPSCICEKVITAVQQRLSSALQVAAPDLPLSRPCPVMMDASAECL